MYVPLHNLWNQYINEIIGDSRYGNCINNCKSGSPVEAKMLKADLHGSILKGNILIGKYQLQDPNVPVVWELQAYL